MRRQVPLILSEAARVSTNPFPFNQFRACVRDRNALNSFPIKRLRTTLIATEGWVPLPPRKSAAYNLPYILPSSVCSKSRVFTLFTKLPGWGVSLPILVHHSMQIRRGAREYGVALRQENLTPSSIARQKSRGLWNLAKSLNVQGNERERRPTRRAEAVHRGARCCETCDLDCGFCGSSRASA